MTSASVQALLELNLKALKLPTILKMYQRIGHQVIDEKLSSEQYLHLLCESEVDARKEKRIPENIRLADFPKQKLLSEFDFSRVTGITEESILGLCQGGFLAEAVNLVMFGYPGQGKTHLAIALGRELCLKGYKVKFFSCAQLAQELVKAKRKLTLSNLFKRLSRIDLLIIDELGFTPLDAEESDLVFQLISERYERKSILITTNLVFSQWTKVFVDELRTTAAIDRVIHHSYVFEFNEEESYRSMEAKKKKELQK